MRRHIFSFSLLVTVTARTERQQLATAVVGDLGSAAVASASASPAISMIDRAIVEATAKKGVTPVKALRTGLGVLRRPDKFVMSAQYRWICLVFASTYAASNVVDTCCEFKGANNVVPKLCATTAANTGTCLAKDAAFARLYGTAVRPLPGTLRDVLTMACAFVLPGPLARVLSAGTAGAAQFICPVACQTFTVVPHLLALDFYNRPAATLQQRGLLLAQKARGTWVLRSLRALPAFGIGVLANNNLRSHWRSSHLSPPRTKLH